MEIITAESIIQAAWEQVFRGLISNAWDSGLGLYFNVEIRVQNFGYEGDGNTFHADWERDFFRSLEFVITARHEVFLRKSDGLTPALDMGTIAPQQWENTSNHDSCWRSDGLRAIWETLVEGHKHCYDHVPTEHQQAMNGMSRHCSVNTGVFSRGLIQLARVSTDTDPERSGWRVMNALKKAEFTINVVDSPVPQQTAP